MTKSFIPFLLVMLLTACLNNAPQGGIRACNCYLNNDCSGNLVCHTGVHCKESTHGSKAQNEIFDNAINNVGLCLVFGPHDPWNPGVPLASVVGQYLESLQMSAASGEGTANEELVIKALANSFSPEQHSSIRSFVTFIAMHALGPASSVGREYVHRPGSYQPPTQLESDRGLENFSTSLALRELGLAHVADEATLAGFSHISNAVVAEIEDPGHGVFRKKMATLREEVPNYNSFDTCEYPHPTEHGHKFAFKDGVECMTIQIEDALSSFLQPDKAQ